MSLYDAIMFFCESRELPIQQMLSIIDFFEMEKISISASKMLLFELFISISINPISRFDFKIFSIILLEFIVEISNFTSVYVDKNS